MRKGSLRASLSKLAEDPDGYPGAITMSGQWHGYCRVRIGQLRVIYSYAQAEDVIYIDYLGPRGEIYKQ